MNRPCRGGARSSRAAPLSRAGWSTPIAVVPELAVGIEADGAFARRARGRRETVKIGVIAGFHPSLLRPRLHERQPPAAWKSSPLLGWAFRSNPWGMPSTSFARPRPVRALRSAGCCLDLARGVLGHQPLRRPQSGHQRSDAGRGRWTRAEEAALTAPGRPEARGQQRAAAQAAAPHGSVVGGDSRHRGFVERERLGVADATADAAPPLKVLTCNDSGQLEKS